MKRTASTFNRIIKTLFVVIPSVYSLVGNLGVLLKLEARIASRSFVKLILAMCGVVVLLLTAWMCVLGMLFVYFLSLHWTPLFSLFVLFLINCVGLIILGFIISRVKKNIAFPETRYQFSRLSQLKDN